MELLEQRILTDGKVLPGGILKVDGFLNHQIDPQLLYEMALEFKRLYDGTGINKILTIEASGIAMPRGRAMYSPARWFSPRRARLRTFPTMSIPLRSRLSPTVTPTPSSFPRSICRIRTGC